MEQSVALLSIGTVMLGVSNLERSIGFYRDTLGMKLQRQFPGFAFFQAGGVTLVLSEPLMKARPGAEEAVEVVFSVNGVRSAHEGLLKRGLNFTQEPRVVTGDLWAANFDDPDGHHLSIFGTA
jgi:glyoxylase I family protein